MKIRVLLFIGLFLYAVSLKAEVRAFINQSAIYQGDPVTLTIESTTNNKANPDLTPLKQDFQILGSSTSTQFKILNGRQQFRKTWTIELQPKRGGDLEIPSIPVGQESTRPLKVAIQQIPANVRQGTKEHVFIESSVDIPSGSTYVQQQIPYTVRLFYDESMQTGQIHSPTVNHAVVEQLGQDRRYQTVRLGKKYSVLEKHYVISPEKSGKLIIPPSIVRGRLLVEDPNAKHNDSDDFVSRFFGKSPFDNDPFFRDFGGGLFSNRARGPSRPFTASTDTIEVEVLPVPAEFTGKAWLPAEDLIIQDSWSENPPQLKVGEPVTRTLTIQAKGLAGSQIPRIEITAPSTVRLYPEESKADTRTDGKTVFGKLEMTMNYLPDKAGDITIPAIKLDWWNVTTRKQQTFTLPEYKLTVLAGAASSANPPQSASVNAPSDKSRSSTPVAGNQSRPTENNTDTKTSSWFNNPLLLAGALLAGVLLLYLLRRQRTRRESQPSSSTFESKNRPPETAKKVDREIADPTIIRRKLEQACTENQADAAEKYLLELAQVSWPDKTSAPRSLAALARNVRRGQAEILELERARYATAAEASDWRGDALWQAVKDGIDMINVGEPTSNEELEPLYPKA